MNRNQLASLFFAVGIAACGSDRSAPEDLAYAQKLRQFEGGKIDEDEGRELIVLFVNEFLAEKEFEDIKGNVHPFPEFKELRDFEFKEGRWFGVFGSGIAGPSASASLDSKGGNPLIHDFGNALQ